MAKATEPRSDDYVEGYKAGYQRGWTDGHSTGYIDAKARIYAALDAIDNLESKASVARMRDVIKMTIGDR